MTSTATATTVDCDLIEQCKENIQPLKSGRNAKKLVARLESQQNSVSKAQDKEMINTKRREMERAIGGYSGDDPLSPWLDYIVWTTQMFPGGGKDSHIVTIVEKCVKRFQKDAKYINNERYVKVWIMYADMCDDPQVVFTHMRKHGIGEDLALFYQAWALWLEQTNKVGMADQVLEDGINRGARPLHTLRTLRKQIEHRAMVALATRIANGEDNTNVENQQHQQRTQQNDENANAVTRRRGLGGAARGGSNSGSTRVRRRVVRPSSSSSRPSSSSSSASSASSSSSSSISVYVESEAAVAPAVRTLDEYVPRASASSVTTTLQPMSVRNKENEVRMSSWQTTTTTNNNNNSTSSRQPARIQPTGGVAPSTSTSTTSSQSIVIYTDEEFIAPVEPEASDEAEHKEPPPPQRMR